VPRVTPWHRACEEEAHVNRPEAVMNPIVDLGSELLFDRSRLVSPYVRLLLAAVGQEVARGSPWVSVNKRVLTVYPIPSELMAAEAHQTAGGLRKNLRWSKAAPRWHLPCHILTPFSKRNPPNGAGVWCRRCRVVA
jgi:hypothetical protein